MFEILEVEYLVTLAGRTLYNNSALTAIFWCKTIFYFVCALRIRQKICSHCLDMCACVPGVRQVALARNWIIKRVSSSHLSAITVLPGKLLFYFGMDDDAGTSTGSGRRRTRDTGGGDDCPVTRSEFGCLFSAISDIQGQLSSMKTGMSRKRREADNRLVKRMKLQHTTVFAKKGNERQYRFNEDVKDKFQAAAAVLNVTPPDVEKAKAPLKEGENLVDKRQKLIKIADRSDHGWSTVKEYFEDELAEDSDDEKRLFRAESRAGRKIKAKANRAKKPASNRGHSHFFNWSGFGSSGVQATGLTPQQPFPQLGAARHTPASSAISIGTSYGPCFQCGKIGHFRRACPLLSQASK